MKLLFVPLMLATGKRTGLSRTTIRKWLRNTEVVAPPTYRRSKGPCKLTAFQQVLTIDALRIKQRRTAKDLFAQIKLDD